MMPASVGAEPAIDALQPEAQNRPRLSRSPHPYHRQSLELPDAIFRTNPDTSTLVSSPLVASPLDYFSAPTAPEQRLTTSPSDSGTEADDERPLLRALTAPPSRPRKGLKSAKSPDGDSFLSPYPTPSWVEEAYAVTSAKSSARRTHATTEHSRGLKKPKAVPIKRQRALVARRAIEVFLLAAVATLTLKNASQVTISTLCFQVVLAIAIYSLYAFKPLIKPHNPGYLRMGDRPSLLSLDPAIALYPLLVPMLVAISLSEDRSLAEVNIILGLCAMPIAAIPLRSFHVQWIVTILPYWYRERWLGTHTSVPESFNASSHAAIYLFPLHFCLKTCLHFLTSTSLLTTELELLSIGLINLLLFADSPQTYILKSLLWIGGISLFVSCKNVFKWTVSLARVPSWKFRKISRSTSFSQPILTAVDDALGGWLSSTWLREANKDSSDSEDNLIHTLRRSVTNPKARSRSGTSQDPGTRPPLLVQSLKIENSISANMSNGHANHNRSRQRRHTLPTAPSALYDLPQLSQVASRNLAKFRNQSRYFPSLTGAQAQILKWIYASFIYFMAIFIILVPIRVYVAHRALYGHEPIGWALGLILGGQDLFRDWVQHWGLDGWISLRTLSGSETSIGQGVLLHFFSRQENIRLAICAYCLICIASGLLLVFQLSSIAEVDTRRKVFHGMMVFMFGTTIFVDPTFISLALMLVLAIFLLLDLFRAGQLPPISRPLTIFLAPYVDGRDHKGPVVISHIFLLIGCAIPLWFSLGAIERTGEGAFKGWDVMDRDLSMVTGVICVGMGDAAASLIGRRFGRRRWPWGGGKSMEGSAAFAVAVVIGLMAARLYLMLGPWPWRAMESWSAAFGKAAVAASAASMTETVLTGANDNVLVPVALWLWVRAVDLR